MPSLEAIRDTCKIRLLTRSTAGALRNMKKIHLGHVATTSLYLSKAFNSPRPGITQGTNLSIVSRADLSEHEVLLVGVADPQQLLGLVGDVDVVLHPVGEDRNRFFHFGHV